MSVGNPHADVARGGRVAAVIAMLVVLICAFSSPVTADAVSGPVECDALPTTIAAGEAAPVPEDAWTCAGSPVSASYAAGVSPLTGGAAPATGGVLLKLILALALVLALILLLQKAARRWGGSFQGGGGPDAICIISSRSVGPRMSLALVQVMNRTLLVGISPQGIRQVADLGEAKGLSTGGPTAAMPHRGVQSDLGIWSRLTAILSRGRLACGESPELALQEAGLVVERRESSSPWSDVAPADSSGADRPGRAHGEGVAGGSTGFEGELSRRLAELRRRYATISEMESGFEGGRP